METDYSFRLVAITIILGVIVALATAAHPFHHVRFAEITHLHVWR
jgi:hypothetical protein